LLKVSNYLLHWSDRKGKNKNDKELSQPHDGQQVRASLCIVGQMPIALLNKAKEDPADQDFPEYICYQKKAYWLGFAPCWMLLQLLRALKALLS
jgi:hypothetical protein